MLLAAELGLHGVRTALVHAGNGCEATVSWDGTRVLLHIIAETAQHAGHADIIRESLDGDHRNLSIRINVSGRG